MMKTAAKIGTLGATLASLAICGHCAAQTVALSIVRLGCGAQLSPLLSPPASQQEREQMSAEWTGADELEVDAWDDETADERVDPVTAKVRLAGSMVTLSYSRRKVAIDGTALAPACMFTVRLFFTVSGLPRSRYQLRIEGGRNIVQPLTIDG